VKPGWQVRPLGEVCDILDSRRKPITKRDRVPGPYPYYGATGVLDHVAGYIFDEPLVLIGEDGAKWGAGDKSAFPISGRTWVNNHAHVIRPSRDVLDDDWLIHFLNFSDLSEFVSGLTVPKLNQGRLREIPIPLPPLDEQRRIVAVLDDAFEGLSRARANTEANLADARELLDAETDRLILTGNSHWKTCVLEDVISRFEYGTSTKSEGSGSVPVLRMGNIQHGEIDWSDLVYTNESSEIDRLSLRDGDVLFNRTNSLEHVGKSAVVRGSRKAIFAGYLVRLHCKPEVLDPEYLNLFLNCRPTREHGRSVSGKSVNQANISAGKLKTYPIRVPPLEEQREIASRILVFRQAFGAVTEAQNRKRKDLDTLRQSLLQKAFAGELT